MFNRSFSSNKFRNNRHNNRNFGGNRHGGGNRQKIDNAKYVNTANVPTQTENHVIIHRFEDFAIDARLKQNISDKGYKTPTPIQDQAIQPILDGKDIVGIANTGTGKTAAFLIPLIDKIIKNHEEKVLIIVPTRELAVQIDEEQRAFSKSLNIHSVLCIGGASINRQIMELRRRPKIIIGTPGRLKDLNQRRFLPLPEYKNIVLDEVDRMVDIGFLHEIKYIISFLPKERQSLCFSATVSNEVNGIISSFLKNPVTVAIRQNEVAPRINQDVIKVRDKNEKMERLQALLKLEEYKKVLIFGRTKWGVERLSKTLKLNGFAADSIHGNKSQNQRLRALSMFKQNQLQILVATDIASRGLDIDDVSHVINFDEPSTYTDYIHRIGRTGRANKSGKALTFVG
jgi:superfamily II DNA/RNA helicase